MAVLTFQEQNTIESLLDMGSGYVSNFSDRTFRLFMGDIYNIDIYDSKYEDQGTSKAKRLRTFLKKENNFVVAEALEKLLDNQKAIDQDTGNVRENLYTKTNQIITRLKNDYPVENISSIRPVDEDTNFTLLAQSVRRSIENNTIIEAIDRLHTYMVRYVRQLCNKHNITFNNSDALNGIFGSYVRYLRENSLVTSTMTIEILGSYVKIFDKYNNTRNNESLAHDNNLINDKEALLILNSIANLIRFVDDLERNLHN